MTPTGDTPILIRWGTVIDGTGTPPQPNTEVLLDGDRIVAVGPNLETTHPDTTIIDATGCTVMPGLIDAHVHVTFDDVQSNDELFFHRDHTLAALIAAQNLQKLLLAGVTGFCDPDTLFSMGPSLRDAVDAGVVEGPRMATGVQALVTSVGGTAGRLIPDTGVVGYAQVVTSIDEMIQMTRRHIKGGGDWIKIHATGSIPRHQGELLAWEVRGAESGVRHRSRAGDPGYGPLPLGRKHQGVRPGRGGPHPPRLVHGRCRVGSGDRSRCGPHAHLHVPGQPGRLRPFGRSRHGDAGRVPGRDRGHRQDDGQGPRCRGAVAVRLGVGVRPHPLRALARPGRWRCWWSR